MPLSDYLVDTLKELKKTSKGECPFPIEEPRKFIQKVRDDSEVHFTIHDLRRTFITIAESLDIGVYTIKTLVNHRTGQIDVTEGYIQINTERLREPMERITNFILTAGGILKGADIVDLNKNEMNA
jgi:integrase